MSLSAYWKKNIIITIDHTKIEEDLYNFPILIKLGGTYSAVFDELGNNFKKLSFISKYSQEQLFCEVAYWDSVSSLAELWVKVPFISASVDTIIHMLYDNTQENNIKYISATGPYWYENGSYTSGVLSQNATIVGDYVRLNTGSTNGYYTVSNVDLQPEFAMSYEHWSGGGTGADRITFCWGQSGVNYFRFSIDEYNSNTMGLSFNGVTLYSSTAGMPDVDNSTWRTVIIKTALQGANINIKVYFGGTKFIDVSTNYIKNETYKTFVWGGETGGSNNEHRVRNLKLYNKRYSVWDDSFMTVYHMSQDPTSTILDSTANINHGTSVGSMIAGDLVDGKIGKALEFDGVSQYINCTDSATLNITGALSLETIVKQTTAPVTDSEGIIGKYANTLRQYSLMIEPTTGCASIAISSDGTAVTKITSTTDITTLNNFVYITSTYKPSTELAIFVNGTKEGSTTNVPNSLYSSSTGVAIGSYWDKTSIYCFNGIIDEVRVSNTVRSDAWIKATNHALDNTLLTLQTDTVVSGTLAYANKITLTIPYGSIGTTLYNFPVLVNLTNSSGLNKQDVTNLFNYLEGPVNRKKIAITDSTGISQCFVEIERWAHSEKSAQLWVKVPIVSSTIDTILYLYYDKTVQDNDIFIGDSQSFLARNVWNSNFYSVHHLSQDPRTVYDSTVNNLSRPSIGGMSDLNITSTSTGNLSYFDGVDDIIGNASWEANTPFNNFSFECVCKAITTHEIDTQANSGTSGTSGEKFIFHPLFYSGSDSGAGVSVGTNGISVYEHASSYVPPLAVYSATIGTEYNHICIVYNAKTPNIYLNGVKVYTGLTSPKTNVYAPNPIGGGTYGYFNGYIGKVRISNVVLSDAWIKATYLSNFDNLIVYNLNTAITPKWLSTYENGVLSPWAKRIKLEIDYTKVQSPLAKFPILVSLSSTSGITSKDLTSFFDYLKYPETFTRDDFTDTTGSLPNPIIWSIVGASSSSCYAIIENGRLKLVSADTSADWKGLYLRSNFTLGDFDIEYEYSTYQLGNDHYTRIGVSTASSTLYVGPRRYQSDAVTLYQSYRELSGAQTDDSSISLWSDGFMRITRTGSIASAYYKHYKADPWILVRTLNSFGTENISITLEHMKRYSSEASFTSYIDNVILNSGIIKWKTNKSIYSKKIAITSDDCITQLPVEIENWDQTAKTIQLWVKVPTITSVSITSLYLYYDITKTDNTTYIGYIGSTIGTSLWSNFLGVYHLGQDPTASIIDSTNNYYNLTSYGSMPSTNVVDVTAGKTLTFDGINDYLSNTSLRFSTNITILCRFYLNSLSGTILHQGNATQNPNQGTSIGIGGDGKITISYVNSSWKYITSQNACNLGENTIGIILDSSNLKYTFYINSMKESGTLPAALTTSTYPFYIGVLNTTSLMYYLNGTIRELRVMNNTDMSLVYFNTVKECFNNSLITYSEPEIYVEPPIIATENYNYVGYVNLQGQPIVRTVLLYERSTGLLVDSTTSDQTGFYNLLCHKNVEHFIVVLDDVNTFIYEPLVKDRLLPNGV